MHVSMLVDRRQKFTLLQSERSADSKIVCMTSFQNMGRGILMSEAEKSVACEWVSMAAAGGAESFAGFAMAIMIGQENARVDFADEKMIMHGGRGRFVNFVH